MIKYVELTPPEASAYRQAKIVSFECKEGDTVKTGDTLFIVQSGNSKLELPSTRDGRIVEFIVSEQESITLSTALLLLETEVDNSTATKPVHHEQQSLDLMPEDKQEINDKRPTPSSNLQKPSPDTKNENDTMSETKIITIHAPDIGADSAKVIEVLVAVGDQIKKEDALLTLESDKASMDIPSPNTGIVKSISVKIDQDVSEGTALLELEVGETANETKDDNPENEQQSDTPDIDSKTTKSSTDSETSETMVEITIPDIGGDSAKVVEILVSVNDSIDVDDSILTLESDKASMDVPSTSGGVIADISVNVGDDVSQGTLVATIKTASPKETPPSTENNNQSDSVSESTPRQQSEPDTEKSVEHSTASSGAHSENKDHAVNSNSKSHASPSIRRFARELGVDLSKVNGSGRKSRITKDDVKGFVKEHLNKPAKPSNEATSGAGIPTIPEQDFSKFGEIEVTPLNKIKRLTANNLHRSWLNVPHVTHNDEANINDLEEFRKQLNTEYKAQGKDIKLSPLAFIVKAVVNALQLYPQFNSSLAGNGENLILKKYVHIGIAVETPDGLVVPVIRDADTKTVAQIATEMGELAAKARNKKLTMNDMSGASFTISSLGGIGGTSFTPIVNAPEVAILGVSRSKIQPVWNGQEFIPGMMLPLSLSYDHRVIDGAEAARFTRHIASVLEDLRRLTI